MFHGYFINTNILSIFHSILIFNHRLCINNQNGIIIYHDYNTFEEFFYNNM